MRKVGKERTSDPILVAGLIRQLLFTPGTCVVRLDGEAHDAELRDVLELSARSKTEVRHLRIHLLRKFDQPMESTQVEIEFGFGRFKAIGPAKVISIDGNAVCLTIPEALELSNVRSSDRLSSDEDLDWCSVLAHTENQHTEVRLKIEDFSSGGFGGSLSSPSEFPIKVGTLVEGRLIGKYGDLDIRSEIVRISSTIKGTDGFTLFQIGLKQVRSSSIDFEEPKVHVVRRYSRLDTDENVLITPVFRGRQKIEILIKDASVTGFAAQLRKSKDSIDLPIGSQFRFEGSTLVVELISRKDMLLSFRITSGSESDRLRWLKRLTHYLQKDASLSSRDARDVLDVFSASGALSGKFLKSHQNLSEKMLEDLESEIEGRFWVHRWISNDSNGRANGHISALKIGDNLWLLGDIVGSPDPLNKLHKEFVPSFFKSFQELSLSLEPCPRHLIMWVAGHPYWKGLEQYIHGGGAGSIFGDYQIAYTRIERAVEDTHSKCARIERIAANDADLIASSINDLSLLGLSELASAFDFNFDHFGSPKLKDAFSGEGQRFYRYYYIVDTGDTRWLAILTGLPLGISLNRVPESAWVFPLVDKHLSDESWTSVVREIQQEALKVGIKLPSVRRFTSNSNQVKKFGELALLRCLLAHPKIWDYYRQADDGTSRGGT